MNVWGAASQEGRQGFVAMVGRCFAVMPVFIRGYLPLSRFDFPLPPAPGGEPPKERKTIRAIAGQALLSKTFANDFSARDGLGRLIGDSLYTPIAFLGGGRFSYPKNRAKPHLYARCTTNIIEKI